MITKEELAAAEKHFPMPGYVVWYYQSFPSRQIGFIGAGLIVLGMVFTAINVGRIHMLSVVLQTCALVIFLCTMLGVAAVKKRSCFKKRASFLGVSFEEYNNAL